MALCEFILLPGPRARFLSISRRLAASINCILRITDVLFHSIHRSPLISACRLPPHLSWASGSNERGQLGLGEGASTYVYGPPQRIEALAAERIVSICAGQFVSAFVSEEGHIFLAGRDPITQDAVYTPILYSPFLGKRCVQISIGGLRPRIPLRLPPPWPPSPSLLDR